MPTSIVVSLLEVLSNCSKSICLISYLYALLLYLFKRKTLLELILDEKIIFHGTLLDN